MQKSIFAAHNILQGVEKFSVKSSKTEFFTQLAGNRSEKFTSEVTSIFL